MNIRQVQDFKILGRGGNGVNAGLIVILDFMAPALRYRHGVDIRLGIPGISPQKMESKKQKRPGKQNGASPFVENDILLHNLPAQGQVIKPRQQRGNQRSWEKGGHNIPAQAERQTGRYPIDQGQRNHAPQVFAAFFPVRVANPAAGQAQAKPVLQQQEQRNFR